jgi:hypothetical protein
LTVPAAGTHHIQLVGEVQQIGLDDVEAGEDDVEGCVEVSFMPCWVGFMSSLS